ncbi:MULTISPECIES: hypothetical protein [unclassified Microcoleus]
MSRSVKVHTLKYDARPKLYNSAVKQARICKASAVEKVPPNNYAEATFTN